MIKNYLLVAWKILLRRKFFTFISLFGICFTLTILLVVSSLLDHVFVPRSPESNFDRVLLVQSVRVSSPDGSSVRESPLGYGLVEKHLRRLQGAENISAYMRRQWVTAYYQGSAIRLNVKRTDAAFWDILDFHFIEGRGFTRDEEQRSAPVAIINTEMRDRFFHGDNAENKTIVLEGQTYRIVGVVENVSRLRSVAHADVWIPIDKENLQQYNELHGSFIGIVLAKHSRDFDRLKAEYQEQLRTVVFPDPKNYNSITSELETQTESLIRELFSVQDSDMYRFMGFVLFFATLFLLLPAVNLVNINMSRIMERSSEIGIRKSFGASSHTLAVQFIVENLVLVGIGGALSFLFAWLVLLTVEASDIIPYATFHLNYRIFVYALLASVFFALFSGVYPAWQMSRMHPVVALKGGVA